MANTRRNQKYLGIDTNVLVAYLDEEHPKHNETTYLKKRKIALNPTVIHEAYHTLVFKMKWTEEEASEVLKASMTDENNLFINQTQRTTVTGLNIATSFHLGGRDALIMSSFIAEGGVRECKTYDKELLDIGEIKYGKKRVLLTRPMNS